MTLFLYDNIRMLIKRKWNRKKERKKEKINKAQQNALKYNKDIAINKIRL